MTTKNWSYAAAASGIVNTATAVMIKAAEPAVVSGGVGYRNYLTRLQIAHDLLSAVTELAIRDGAGGTVLFRTKLQTPASEQGITFDFNPPLQGTTNTLMEVVTLTAVTGGVYINAQGTVNA